MEDSRSWFPLLRCGRTGFSSTVNSPSRRVERRSRVQIADCLRWAGGDEERRKEGECILKSQRRKGWGARSLAIRSGRLIFLTQSTRTDLSAVFGRRNGLAVSRRGAGRSPGAGPGGVPRSSFVWLPEGAGRGRRWCRYFLAGVWRGELAFAPVFSICDFNPRSHLQQLLPIISSRFPSAISILLLLYALLCPFLLPCVFNLQVQSTLLCLPLLIPSSHASSICDFNPPLPDPHPSSRPLLSCVFNLRFQSALLPAPHLHTTRPCSWTPPGPTPGLWPASRLAPLIKAPPGSATRIGLR